MNLEGGNPVEHIGCILQMVVLGTSLLLTVFALVLGPSDATRDDNIPLAQFSSGWLDRGMLLSSIQGVLVILSWLWLALHTPWFISNGGLLKFWLAYCYLGLTPFVVLAVYTWSYHRKFPWPNKGIYLDLVSIILLTLFSPFAVTVLVIVTIFSIRYTPEKTAVGSPTT